MKKIIASLILLSLLACSNQPYRRVTGSFYDLMFKGTLGYSDKRISNNEFEITSKVRPMDKLELAQEYFFRRATEICGDKDNFAYSFDYNGYKSGQVYSDVSSPDYPTVKGIVKCKDITKINYDESFNNKENSSFNNAKINKPYINFKFNEINNGVTKDPKIRNDLERYFIERLKKSNNFAGINFVGENNKLLISLDLKHYDAKSENLRATNQLISQSSLGIVPYSVDMTYKAKFKIFDFNSQNKLLKTYSFGPIIIKDFVWLPTILLHPNKKDPEKEALDKLIDNFIAQAKQDKIF